MEAIGAITRQRQMSNERSVNKVTVMSNRRDVFHVATINDLGCMDTIIFTLKHESKTKKVLQFKMEVSKRPHYENYQSS